MLPEYTGHVDGLGRGCQRTPDRTILRTPTGATPHDHAAPHIQHTHDAHHSCPRTACPHDL